MKSNATLVAIVLAAATAACGGKSTSSASPGNLSGGSGGPVALPGPCVDIVADATTRQGHSEQRPDDRVGPDLDGDGTADHQVVTTDPEGMVTEHVLYYVVRGDCAHYVGDLGQVEPTLGPDRHGGLADLSVIDNTVCEGARCGCEVGTTWFRFDGAEYRIDPAASTPSTENQCPDD